MKNNDPYERYQRQVLLKELGESGQQKLLRAKVLVVGAGGLGCPVLQYLTAAGVGTIGIVDDDRIALHNLHRQPLYATNDVGASKALVAVVVLQRMNPEINFKVFNERLTVENALSIIDSFDIIVDGTDNFATRYMINDACVLLGKPLVYGAILQFEGQIAVFGPYSAVTNIGGVNYRDIFPQPPKEDDVLNCAEAGVLGVLPGIIGTMMANETIKIITGIGTPLFNRVLTFNALHNQFYELQITPREETRSLIPASKDVFKKMDYNWLCAAAMVPEIDVDEFDKLVQANSIDIIDVREHGEKPAVHEFDHLQMPLQHLKEIAPPQKETVVVFCQTGKRSRKAVKILTDEWGGSKKVFSLKGGIEAWKKQHNPPLS